MAKKKLKKKAGDKGSLTTAAGLARKLGVNRSTVSRRIKKKGMEGTRVGHQFILNRSAQGKVSRKK